MSKVWNDEVVARLVAVVGSDTSVPVTHETLEEAVVALQDLEVSSRSVAAKLRSLGYTQEKVEVAHTFTETEAAALTSFIQANPGQFTYAEIAQNVFGDAKTGRQVQGKILALKLHDLVKATPKTVAPRTYSEAEESQIVGLIKSGLFLEDIAEQMDRTVNSVRGKALSLLRSGAIDSLPVQKTKKVQPLNSSDLLASITDIKDKSVADLAVLLSKTERSVKTLLTKAGVSCSNYDGAKKAAKNAAKEAA